eukprot:6570734-Prymnesium_polylepis.1
MAQAGALAQQEGAHRLRLPGDDGGGGRGLRARAAQGLGQEVRPRLPLWHDDLQGAEGGGHRDPLREQRNEAAARRVDQFPHGHARGARRAARQGGAVGGERARRPGGGEAAGE